MHKYYERRKKKLWLTAQPCVSFVMYFPQLIYAASLKIKLLRIFGAFQKKKKTPTTTKKTNKFTQSFLTTYRQARWAQWRAPPLYLRRAQFRMVPFYNGPQKLSINKTVPLYYWHTYNSLALDWNYLIWFLSHIWIYDMDFYVHFVTCLNKFWMLCVCVQ